MVTAAAIHGIDLSLMWGTIDRPTGRPARVRQVCLAVPGSGKTAMLVVSGPGEDQPAEVARAERVASINAACTFLKEEAGRGVRPICLAQALPEPHETWAITAFEGAGFMKVGDLAYLRAKLGLELAQSPVREPTWPEGVTVRNVRDLGIGAPDRAALLQALDKSYVDTLDCPELCGLRETTDVLESHRAAGTFDPKLWWLVFLQDQPMGCMLFSCFPEQGSAELVYLGLGPELRGNRLGSLLLDLGLRRAAAAGNDTATCAVDLRNTPAMRLYERAGFKEFGRRVAMVRPIRPHPTSDH